MTTTVTPSSGQLLLDAVDQEKAKEIFSDPAKASAWVKDYDEARVREQKDVVDAAKSEFAATIGDLVPRGTPANQDAQITRPKNYNPEAPGAAIEGVFKNKGEFFRAVWDKQTDKDLISKRNSITTTGDGGFLVPESMRADFVNVSLETSVVRPRATVIPMATSRVKIPVVDSTSNETTVFGGVQVYGTAEEAAITASQPKFGEIVLDADKITAMVYATREMLADSPISIEGLLNNLVPQAIAHFEDHKFLNGNGVGTPLGILNAGNKALVSVAKEDLQVADTIVYENIVKMFARLLPGSYSRSVWLASPDTIPELMTMGLSIGAGGLAVFNADATAAPTMTLLGRPIIFTEKASKVGDKGDIALVDMSYYYIGDRQTMEAMASEHFAFANDKIAYRFIERVDGRPGLLSSITPKNGGPALSPFVTLNARA